MHVPALPVLNCTVQPGCQAGVRPTLFEMSIVEQTTCCCVSGIRNKASQDQGKKRAESA